MPLYKYLFFFYNIIYKKGESMMNSALKKINSKPEQSPN